MNIRDQIKGAIESQTKMVHFKIKNGFMKNTKIPFKIKPITAGNLISKEIIKNAMQEMSQGQTIDDASRVAAENFKRMFQACCRIIIGGL